MRISRWVLGAALVLLATMWVAALTSTPGSAGADDLGRGLVAVVGFAAGHIVALVLALVALGASAWGLLTGAVNRTRAGYATLVASGLVTALVVAYLGFFLGAWGA